MTAAALNVRFAVHGEPIDAGPDDRLQTGRYMDIAHLPDTDVGTRITLELAPLGQIAHDFLGGERYARRAGGDHRRQSEYRRMLAQQPLDQLGGMRII